MITENILEVDGNELPTPSTVSVSRNKVWSQNSGRTKSATFTGDLIAIKWRVDATWQYVSEATVKQILQSLEPAFINVRFKNPRNNAFETKKFYGGDESLTVYNYDIEEAVYESVTVSLVEK